MTSLSVFDRRQYLRGSLDSEVYLSDGANSLNVIAEIPIRPDTKQDQQPHDQGKDNSQSLKIHGKWGSFRILALFGRSRGPFNSPEYYTASAYCTGFFGQS